MTSLCSRRASVSRLLATCGLRAQSAEPIGDGLRAIWMAVRERVDVFGVRPISASRWEIPEMFLCRLKIQGVELDRLCSGILTQLQWPVAGLDPRPPSGQKYGNGWQMLYKRHQKLFPQPVKEIIRAILNAIQ